LSADLATRLYFARYFSPEGFSRQVATPSLITADIAFSLPPQRRHLPTLPAPFRRVSYFASRFHEIAELSPRHAIIHAIAEAAIS